MSLLPQPIRRYIAVYEDTGEQLTAEVTVSADEFERIRGILDANEIDPLYECYPLEGIALTACFELLQGRLPVGDYAYFLEASGPAI